MDLQQSARSGELASYGLRNAMGRLNQEVLKQDRNGVPVSAVEGVMWVVALDDHWKRVDGYMRIRDADPDGQVVLGLRWARNRSIHDLIDVAKWDQQVGMFAPITFPLVFQPNWSITFKVELGEPPKKNLEVFDAYRTHVAGNQVGACLSTARRWFDAVEVRLVEARLIDSRHGGR